LLVSDVSEFSVLHNLEEHSYQQDEPIDLKHKKNPETDVEHPKDRSWPVHIPFLLQSSSVIEVVLIDWGVALSNLFVNSGGIIVSTVHHLDGEEAKTKTYPSDEQEYKGDVASVRPSKVVGRTSAFEEYIADVHRHKYDHSNASVSIKKGMNECQAYRS